MTTSEKDADRLLRQGMLKERAAIMKWLRRWQTNHVDCRAHDIEECVTGLLCEISGGAHERFYEEAASKLSGDEAEFGTG